MRRLVYALALTLMLMAAACSPAVPSAAVMPTFVQPQQEATPAPNEAYPTSQASEAVASQTVSGFSLTLQRAWRDGKQVLADVCFTLPDSSDWTIWNAHFEYGGQTVSEFSSSLLNEQTPAAGTTAQRCDELSFYVPPDADLSAAGLTIESVGAYPTADEYCSLYMPKIQQALQDRGIAITLDCPEVNGTRSMQIVSKPEAMSQQDAEQLVYSDEFYTVRGPWSFPVTFSP